MNSKHSNKNPPVDNRRDILTEQLIQNIYECIICWDIVHPHQSIWSCSTYFGIFHFNCVYKWASVAMFYQQTAVEMNNYEWKCPACQSMNKNFPNPCKCFCGGLENGEKLRKTNPSGTGTGSKIPHCCGNKCGKSKCSHECNLTCHPGPCPPCNIQILKPCECKYQHVLVSCNSSKTEKKYCSYKCGNKFNCGIHKCKRLCHSPPCQKCPEVNLVACHCGKNSKSVRCTGFLNLPYSCGGPSCHSSNEMKMTRITALKIQRNSRKNIFCSFNLFCCKFSCELLGILLTTSFYTCTTLIASNSTTCLTSTFIMFLSCISIFNAFLSFGLIIVSKSKASSSSVRRLGACGLKYMAVIFMCLKLVFIEFLVLSLIDGKVKKCDPIISPTAIATVYFSLMCVVFRCCNT